MSDTPERSPEEAAKGRRWFVILAIVTLVGFALFVGVITVCAVRIPELKKPKYGLHQSGIGDRSA
jgi:hypothetical protein